jgi:hypothetical protein
MMSAGLQTGMIYRRLGYLSSWVAVTFSDSISDTISAIGHFLGNIICHCNYFLATKLALIKML